MYPPHTQLATYILLTLSADLEVSRRLFQLVRVYLYCVISIMPRQRPGTPPSWVDEEDALTLGDITVAAAIKLIAFNIRAWRVGVVSCADW